MRYIIVADYEGIPYFLQMRRVLNWCFFNNHIKHFKTLKTAISNADMVKARYRVNAVHVIGLTDEDNYITSASITRYYNTPKEFYYAEKN